MGDSRDNRFTKFIFGEIASTALIGGIYDTRQVGCDC